MRPGGLVSTLVLVASTTSRCFDDPDGKAVGSSPPTVAAPKKKLMAPPRRSQGRAPLQRDSGGPTFTIPYSRHAVSFRHITHLLEIDPLAATPNIRLMGVLEIRRGESQVEALTREGVGKV